MITKITGKTTASKDINNQSENATTHTTQTMSEAQEPSQTHTNHLKSAMNADPIKCEMELPRKPTFAVIMSITW